MKAARKLRIRVGVGGVEIISPDPGQIVEAETFLLANGDWVVNQLDRISRLHSMRREAELGVGEILFRGTPTRVRIEAFPQMRRANRVEWRDGSLAVVAGPRSRTTPPRILELWLRRQARMAIEEQVAGLARRLKVAPNRIYVMDQRTKWGNCSAMQNLSFNWRIVMAPEFVLRYLVTHETVHLAVPDHSRRFWLTVQSLCPDAERGRQWLSASGNRLLLDLTTVFDPPR